MKQRLQQLGVVLLLALLAGCATIGEDGQVIDKEKKRAAVSQANTMLGVEYLRAGNYEMSREKLEKALAADPDNTQAHDAIAVLFEQVGEPDKAEKHYKKSLRLDPDNPRGHNNYGQFLCARGRYKDAEKEFLTAANDPFYPVPSLALTNAGLCALRIPDEEMAEKYFRKALEFDPKYPPALLQMATLSYSRSNYLSARGYLQRYRESGQDTPESLWLGIRTEYALDDHRAWGNYALILRNNFPNSPQAAELQKWEYERRSGK
ncbi:MAG: type IV pilus biogenesis/stability protein PilW [Gammaproteobacteria bacterium]|jgi:type IV pilus assembly protein PilF